MGYLGMLATMKKAQLFFGMLLQAIGNFYELRGTVTVARGEGERERGRRLSCLGHGLMMQSLYQENPQPEPEADPDLHVEH